MSLDQWTIDQEISLTQELNERSGVDTSIGTLRATPLHPHHKSEPWIVQGAHGAFTDRPCKV